MNMIKEEEEIVSALFGLSKAKIYSCPQNPFMGPETSFCFCTVLSTTKDENFLR